MRKLFVKICYALAFSASALAFAFLGTGCGAEEPSGHQHSWTEAYDKTYHWWFCPDDNTIKDKSEHILDVEGECLVCTAFSGETEGVLYEEAGDHAKVVGCEQSYGKIRILSTYNGLPVTEIGESAFSEKYISGVVIPNTVVSIGKWAFLECESLKYLILPESITTIEESAFEDCEALTKVEIPDSVISLGESVFQSCENLTEITLSKNVKRIPTYAFRWCSNLPSVEIPEGVTAIGKGAFHACYELGDIKLPNTLTTIEEEAFSMCCRKLVSLDVPNSVETIERNAFYHAYYLMYVDMSLGIKNLDINAFRDCKKLQYNEYKNVKYFGNGNNPYAVLVGVSDQTLDSYTIHADTKVIVNYSMASLHAATRIEIPDGVTTICSGAFTECDNVTAVIIPKSVAYIGEKAFDRCEKATFYCKAESLPSGWHVSWNNLNREVNWNY